ncbi:MAG TPA: hypothetical protein VNM67_06840 [Thermoanaerobaculia bacterium]|jgi:hypothetical protein|nr:hypothetical protein [Thermoanaerobaculia bacterium]
MRRDRPTDLSLWRRSLIALAVGLALTFGAIAPHDASAEHEQEGRGAFVDQAASHPEDPPHIEASNATYIPGCQTCLLQLQTGSRLIAPPVPLPDLVRGETVPVVETVAVSTPSSLLGPARAPPASSLVL